jgi:hypothetical protein
MVPLPAANAPLLLVVAPTSHVTDVAPPAMLLAEKPTPLTELVKATPLVGFTGARSDEVETEKSVGG